MPQYYPAVEFEQRYGITGISGEYTPPRGLSWRAFEHFFEITLDPIAATINGSRPRRFELELRRAWPEIVKFNNDLVAANPDLAIVQRRPLNMSAKFPDMISALKTEVALTAGVVSRFSAQDIEYFINRDPKSPRHHFNLSVDVNGTPLQYHPAVEWMASPHTIAKMEAHSPTIAALESERLSRKRAPVAKSAGSDGQPVRQRLFSLLKRLTR